LGRARIDTVPPLAAQSFEHSAAEMLDRLSAKLHRGPPSAAPITADLLTEYFGVNPEQIRAHHQFYNTNLGALVENLVFGFLDAHSPLATTRKVHDGKLELADITLGVPPGADPAAPPGLPPIAIEVKYRYGSQDSKQVKATASYAQRLTQLGYEPLMWVFRDDSAPKNLTTCRHAGWQVLEAGDAFDWLAQQCQGLLTR
jgi:hypothetical protein